MPGELRRRDEGGVTATPALSGATRLAVERTRLAYERTLMAWVRTATGLISFGFAIYKFFQFLNEQRQAAHPQRPFGSREFGMTMIVVGLVALVLATFQHRENVKRLREQYVAVAVPYSLAIVVASLVAGFGILGLLLVVFRE
jgi:putative membrane protein